MTINPAIIERLKKEIDLVQYIESRGVTLTKVGFNHKGLCPFHEEQEPSFTVNPRDNLWHCFGCSSGGDIFTFVERLDKVRFIQAVKTAAKFSKINPEDQVFQASETKPQVPKSSLPQTRVKKIKLLNHVIRFYQKEFYQDKRGLSYLRERGIYHKQSYTDFGVGFVSGNLPEVLPGDEETINQLKEIGILNKNGHEMFYGSVVFPLTDFNGDCVGLYGRRVDAEQVSHLYLPGPRRGLVNWQAAKRSSSLIFTESVIDGLTLYDKGFKNVIPVYGTNGFTEYHTELFKNHPIEQVYLAFDNDEAGHFGALNVKNKIKAFRPTGRRVKVDVVILPEKDVNEYFLNNHCADDFQKILETSVSKDSASETHLMSPVKKERFYEPTETGFRVAYGKREYEIKGIARMGTQLKATIKASPDIRFKNSSGARFQITTIDFYSLRSREWFAKILAELFSERFEIVFEDLNKLLMRTEDYQPFQKDSDKKIVLTESERREALDFLQNPSLLDEVLTDLEFLGFTGEMVNKIVAYLVAISRKMEEPLSLLIQSRSAAGKSTLQDAILKLAPKEDQVKYTRLTDQALFYKAEDSLVHKILAIEEAAGLGGSAYSIRALQSAKELTVATTSKDPTTGKMKTEEYKVKGPLSIMCTTTDVVIDVEMESRFLNVSVDESKDMTEKIHDKQRESETLEGYLAQKTSELVFKKHHNAQRLLKPLAVINPYAPHLKFPSDHLRSRRDHKKYLGLIKAVAFLHQYQREIKSIKQDGIILEYIEVTLSDIKTANELANIVLGRSLDELTASSRTLLGIIQDMVGQHCKDLDIKPKDFVFNRRMIREFSKWSDWQVKTHIQELEELGYVYSHMGSKGKEYVYELKATDALDPGQKTYLDLTDISQLEKIPVNLDKLSLDKLSLDKLSLEGQKAHLVAL